MIDENLLKRNGVSTISMSTRPTHFNYDLKNSNNFDMLTTSQREFEITLNLTEVELNNLQSALLLYEESWAETILGKRTTNIPDTDLLGFGLECSNGKIDFIFDRKGIPGENEYCTNPCGIEYIYKIKHR